MTGWALVVVGVVNIVALLFPMHTRSVLAEGGATSTDTMHQVVTAANVTPFLLAMGVGAWAFGRRFRVFSLATLVTLIVFGAIAGSQAGQIGANQPTPMARSV